MIARLLQLRAFGSSAPTTRWRPVRRSRASRAFAFAVLATLCLLAALVGQAAASGVEGAPAARRPKAAGLVYGFFDDATGARNGRLRIEHVRMAYGRQGFLRVAWRPQAVLEGVNLEIAPTATWPAAGRQIADALRSQGEIAELREITVQLPGGKALHARSGRLRADGALELQEVEATAGSGPASPAHCLWLAGPDAGRCVPYTAERSEPSRRTVSTPSRPRLSVP